MRFLAFLDTTQFYPNEPQAGKARLSFGMVCFILMGLGFVVEMLGVYFLAALLALAGFVATVLVAVCYFTVLAFDYFSGNEVTFY